MVGPLTRAHFIHARPEPGASDGQRPSSAQVRPWTSGSCKGRPWLPRGRTPPTSFPRAPTGRAAALPADGGSASRLAAGGIIVSEAYFCMGGPFLTVCAPPWPGSRSR